MKELKKLAKKFPHFELLIDDARKGVGAEFNEKSKMLAGEEIIFKEPTYYVDVRLTIELESGKRIVQASGKGKSTRSAEHSAIKEAIKRLGL